jgi:hypothetical protein
VEALTKITSTLPEGLTEIQQENLVELLENLEPIEGLDQQVIPSLASTRLSLEGARIRQNTGTDDLAPEDIEPGDIYVPGAILARHKEEGIVVSPLFGWSGNVRWLSGDRVPDCFSNDRETSGESGAKCADCPDLPFRDGEMTDCARVWHWTFLSEDCSRVFYVMFRGKSARTGSNLARLTRNRGGSKLVRLFSEGEKNKKGAYFVWKSALLGDKPSPPIKKLGLELSKMISAKYQEILAEDLNAGTQYSPADDDTPIVDVEPSTGDIEDM